MIYISNSEKQTKQLAFRLAKKYLKGGLIFLLGNLGAGKTTFTQGFARGLNIKDKIISPTFILIKEYPLPHAKNGKFYHIDLYRLESEKELISLGLKEILENKHNVVLIEWAEKGASLQNIKHTRVEIKVKTKTQREIEITTRP